MRRLSSPRRPHSWCTANQRLLVGLQCLLSRRCRRLNRTKNTDRQRLAQAYALKLRSRRTRRSCRHPLNIVKGELDFDFIYQEVLAEGWIHCSYSWFFN